MPVTIKTGTVKYKDPTTGNYIDIDAAGGDIADVQMNNTSIVSNGVANIPIADIGSYGVVKYQPDYGISYQNHCLCTRIASEAQCKAGVNVWRPIVPVIEHLAAFYGLAKAAGDSTQSSSSNAVGTYTDEAKIAIQKMLGVRPIYGPMEKIADYTLPSDSTQVTVNTDLNGLPFKLAHACITYAFGTPTTSTRDYVSGCIFDQDGISAVLPTLRLITAGATNCWFVYDFHTFNGLPYLIGKSSSTGNTQTAEYVSYSSTSGNEIVMRNITAFTGIKFTQYSSTSTLLPQGGRIVIYGCRLIED